MYNTMFLKLNNASESGGGHVTPQLNKSKCLKERPEILIFISTLCDSYES